MAQLNSRDRLQPSLLDRLLDDEPQAARETAEARVLTRQQLRAAVLRDLSWLFNAIRAEPDELSELQDEVRMWQLVPHARRSVVNYGMPAYSGVTLSALDRRRIEHSVHEAIATFEPRIDPQTLEVEVRGEDGSGRENTLQLVIRGKMWSQPVPLELLLAADLDIETGHTRVREMR